LSGIPAIILVFKRNRKNKDIIFIDSSREFNKDKNQNSIDESHINKIIGTYRKRIEIGKYSHLAS